MKRLDDVSEYLNETAEEMIGLREIDNLEMYRMLTDLGNDLTPLNDGERTDDNYVYGCISNVYVAAELTEDGAVVYRGESESHVVRGYLAVLVEALSGLPPEAIVSGSRDLVEQFARETDIKASLTPNRANAFGNIYELMVVKAATFEKR